METGSQTSRLGMRYSLVAYDSSLKLVLQQQHRPVQWRLESGLGIANLCKGETLYRKNGLTLFLRLLTNLKDRRIGQPNTRLRMSRPCGDNALSLVDRVVVPGLQQ